MRIFSNYNNPILTCSSNNNKIILKVEFTINCKNTIDTKALSHLEAMI